MPKKTTTMESQVTLGERYRDTVTGYEGVATACCFYLHGCERVTLEQWIASEAQLKELTFDAPRLVHLPTEKPVKTRRTGGVKPAMPRGQANP